MKILIGKISNNVTQGIYLGQNSGRHQIISVSGLETPPIRNNYNNWSGNDGGYVSSQLYGARTITIKGFYEDKTAFCEGVESARQELIKNLLIRKKYPLFFELANKDLFFTEGYLIDFKMDFTSYVYGEFQISFICPDECLYIAEKFGDIESVTKRKRLNKSQSGGHLVPEDLPVLFEEGRENTVVDNDGTIQYYPTFTLIGPFTKPITITNQTTNKSFTIDRDIDNNEVVIIDMKNKEVTSAGQSIAYEIGEGSDWIYINPGLNRIVFTSEGQNDTDYIDIEWKNSIGGI